MLFRAAAILALCFIKVASANPQNSRNGDVNEGNGNSGGPSEEDSCKTMSDYDCSEEPDREEEIQQLKELELWDEDEEEPHDGGGEDIDARNLDFSFIEEETGFNLSGLVRRAELDGLRGQSFHDKVDELLLGDESIVERDSTDHGNLRSELLGSYRLLTKRAGGGIDYPFCKDTNPMTYKSPAYPGATELYDLEKWDDCSNFKFGKKSQGVNGKHKNRLYADEHILERQMVQRFAEAKIDKEPSPVSGHTSLCHYLGHYWGGTTRKSYINGVRPWDMIGAAWPSTTEHADEIVKLEYATNGMKARLFKNEVALRAEDKMKAKLNYKEAWFVTQNLRVAIILAKYMDHKDINDIYKEQATRVEKAFNKVENALLDNWKNDPVPYKKQNFARKWKSWMKSYTKTRIQKLKDFIKKYADEIDKEVLDKTKRPAGHRLTPREKSFLKKAEDTVKEARKVIHGRNKPFKNPF